MLDGDADFGKTYLLGRLKQTLNSEAFFVYINPFPQSDHIWRHILRCTINSLLQIPAGQQDSQFLLWFKSLPAFRQRSFVERVLQDNVWDLIRSERQRFIDKVAATYERLGIYNPSDFFGALYNLNNPKLRSLACRWLRGDTLNEESLKALRINRTIDTEDAAHEVLANFGRISAETKPIVLCFDQLESIARLPDNSIDLPALFRVNTSIHSKGLKNFLVIISITTDTWKQNASRIDQSDKARIDREVHLQPITLDRAEALWAVRLYPLHCQAAPQPPSPLYPLSRQWLEKEFPGGKVSPRNVLMLGQQLIQMYKDANSLEHRESAENNNGLKNLLPAFQLLWQKRFKETQQSITKIHRFSSLELMRMLQKALAALEVEEIKKPLLTRTNFDRYFLSYQLPAQPGLVGVGWVEDQNMSTFFHVMDACRKTLEQNLCQTLYLIRFEGVGNLPNKGHQFYTQIFTGSPHRRIKPDIISVQYLQTHYSLVKDAYELNLVVEGKFINSKALQALIRESKVLHDCPLIQDLGIVERTGVDGNGRRDGNDGYNQQIKEFLLNQVSTEPVIGRQIND